MKLRFTWVLSLLTVAVFAQNIEGVVLNAETNKTIAAAHISMNDEVVAITTNEGTFELKLDAKNSQKYSIFISHIGFMTQKVEIPTTQNKLLTIYLKPDTSELSQVVIDGENTLQAKINFTEKASLKKGLFDFAAEIVDGKIYVIGGDNSQNVDRFKAAVRATNDKFIEPTFDNLMSQMDFVSGSIENVSEAMYVYDIAQDTWTTSDVTFRERTAHNMHVYNNELYIIGGKRDAGNKVYLDDVIEIFNLTSNVIKEDTPNPHQAVNFASFSYNNYLILMGGIKKISKRGTKTYTKDIHFYNLTSGLWYKLGEMPTGKETQGVLIDDVIYLVGGFNKKPLNTIESFNLTTGKWNIEAKLFDGMEQPAVTSHGKTIYIYNNQRLYTYNVVTKEHTEYLIDLTVEAASLFYHDNGLYLVGGILKDGFYSVPSKKVFHIDVEEFAKTRIYNSKTITQK